MAWTAPRTYVTGELITSSILNTHVRDNLISVLPVGTFILRAAAYTTTETAVEGRFLQCNGVAVSRTTYSTLFSYLNGLSPALPFGVGNGTTTFNLPDTRGRIAIAEGEHGDVDDMGDSDGIATVASRTPRHFHLSQYGTNSAGGTVPNAASFDTAVTRTYTTTPTGVGGLQDAPCYTVLGSYFVKYL